MRLISGSGHYRYRVSPEDFEKTPPKFSDRTFDQLVNLAFSPEYTVTSLDHEIWEALDKGSEK